MTVHRRPATIEGLGEAEARMLPRVVLLRQWGRRRAQTRAMKIERLFMPRIRAVQQVDVDARRRKTGQTLFDDSLDAENPDGKPFQVLAAILDGVDGGLLSGRWEQKPAIQPDRPARGATESSMSRWADPCRTTGSSPQGRPDWSPNQSPKPPRWRWRAQRKRSDSILRAVRREPACLGDRTR